MTVLRPNTFALFVLSIFLLVIALLYVNLSLSDFRTPPRHEGEYPPGVVPEKFLPDGSPARFAGNSIVSFLPNSSVIYRPLREFHGRLAQSPNAYLFALLPPSSWHMTVLGGALHPPPEPGYWPTNLAMDASLEYCNSLFVEELSNFDLQTSLPFRLRVTGLTSSGLGLHIQPHQDDGTALRILRDRLAQLLHIRYPDHETFPDNYHISIAYLLRYLTKEQEDEIQNHFRETFKDLPMEFELDAPALVKFENLLAYNPVLYLKNSVS